MDKRSQVKISSIAGNTQLLDGGAMFGNVPRALWERWVSVDEQGRIPLACRAMLIEVDDQKILCETGIGAYMEPALASRYGVRESEHRLIESLRELQIEPDEIDFVILSHLHFDHAGGLLYPYSDRQNGQTGLLFQNSQYVVGKEAWQRALNPHPRDRASFIPGLVELLQESGRLLLVDGNHVPGIDPDNLRVIFSSGHTPGQMHTIVQGSRDTLVFAGDLVPGRAWVHLPVTMGYDRFAEQVIDEKAALYADLVSKSWRLFFTHDSEVAASRVRKDDKGRFVPWDDLPTLNRFVI